MATWASIAKESHRKSLGVINKKLDGNQSLPFMFEFLKEYLLLKNIHNVSNISEIGVYNIDVILNLKKFIFDYFEFYTNYDVAIYIKNHTNIIKNLIIELINEYQSFYIYQYLDKFYTSINVHPFFPDDRILRITRENLLSIFNFEYLNDYIDLDIRKGILRSYTGYTNYHFCEILSESKFIKEKLLREGVFKICFDFSNGEKDELLKDIPDKCKKYTVILNKNCQIRYREPGSDISYWLSLGDYFYMYGYELNNIDNDITKKDNWRKFNFFIQKIIKKIAFPLLKANLF